MEPGITWYDVLGAVPDAEASKIKRKYEDKAALLRPELLSGAPSNVVKAVTRAPSARAYRGDKLTVRLWHPPAQSSR